MCLFDLCPDIEELITNELAVLLKFREATAEFKLRMNLNSKSLKKRIRPPERLYSKIRYSPVGPNILKCCFPFSGDHYDYQWGVRNEEKIRNPNIHGFIWAKNGKDNWLHHDWWGNEVSVVNLNKTLTELGAKKFKSKKKSDKIKMLMNY
jgi:hypothetical protein